MTRNNNFTHSSIDPATLTLIRNRNPDRARRIEVYIKHIQDIKARGGARRHINQALWMQAFVAAWWFWREGWVTDDELAKPLLAMEQDLDAPEVIA